MKETGSPFTRRENIDFTLEVLESRGWCTSMQRRNWSLISKVLEKTARGREVLQLAESGNIEAVCGSFCPLAELQIIQRGKCSHPRLLADAIMESPVLKMEII